MNLSFVAPSRLAQKAIPAKMLCPLIFCLAGLVSVLWFEGESLIYWGDFIFPIDRALFFKQTFYSWIDSSVGGDKLQAIGEIIPFGLFVFLSDVLHLSLSLAQKIWIYIMFTASGLCMYFLALSALKDEPERYWAGLLAGLFYMFNPWTATHLSFLWQHVVFMPLALGFYIKGLNENKGFRYAIGFALVVWITSTTSITNMRAIVLEGLLMFFYFIYYVIAHKDRFRQALHFSFWAFFFFLLFSFYIWMPLLTNIMRIVKETASTYQDINFTWLDAFNLNSSAPLIDSLRFLGSWALTAGDRGYPYYSWYTSYRNIFFILASFWLLLLALFPVFLFTGGSRHALKKMAYFFLIIFLLGLLITLGKNNSLTLLIANKIKYFTTLFSLPSFHGGTFMVIGFCVLYGIGFNTIVNVLKIKSKKWLVFIIFLGLIALYGFPVWSGQLIRPRNPGFSSPRFQIPEYYEHFTKELRAKKSDFKLFSAPYSKLVYFETTWGFGGVDFLENMTNKSIIRGTGFNQRLAETLNENPQAFARIGSLLNLKYMVHRRDANLLIQENPWYVFYDTDLLNNFFKNFTTFVKTDGLLDLYTMNKDYFLPHFYTPENIIVTNRPVEALPQMVSSKSYSIRSVFYFKDRYIDRMLEYLKKLKNKAALPVLEFKKINPVKYRIRVHRARDNFMLVFSEKFHDGWKIYLGRQPQPENALLESLREYILLEGNQEEQATPVELVNFVERGWVSALRRNGQAHFVSKNFKDTIQNDNLKSGSRLETLFQASLEENKNHWQANGYANAWVIDLDTVKQIGPVISHEDGSVDFELIVEFWPQRLYYIGLGISGAALVICLGYLYFTRKRKT